MTTPTSPTPATNGASRARPPAAIIMAAGMGKRMKSDLPKVLHPIGGRPMVCAVIDACRAAGCRDVVLIVGHRQDLVRDAIQNQYGPNHGVTFVLQPEQLGTGHAVRCAKDHFANAPADADVFVLAGDGPLIRPGTLTQLLTLHRTSGAGATLATSRIDDPTGYGRIVRDADGRFVAIVEHKDCTPQQLAITEVNPSYYCFNTRSLFAALERVQRSAGGEFYLTDVPALMLSVGDRVEVIDAVPPQDVLSINTLEQLAEVDAIYTARTRQPAGAGREGTKR